MGLSDQEMERLLCNSLPDINSSPVEHDVYAAVGGYKLALIRTSHKSAWHRIMCWAGDKESLAHEASLLRSEQHAKDVLGKSPEHRLAFERIVKSQPDDIARKDNLLSLLRGSIEP